MQEIWGDRKDHYCSHSLALKFVMIFSFIYSFIQHLLVTCCVLVAEWLAFGTASLTARVRSCGREAYKRFDSSAHTPGSEPSIIGGLVYRESHPRALKRSLDAYGELQVPITNNFSSSKVDVCFSCAATLCKDKELIIITLMNGNRVVMKRCTHIYVHGVIIV